MTIRMFIAAAVGGLLLAAAPAQAQDGAQDDAAAKQQMINNPDPSAFQVYGLTIPPRVIKDKAVQGGRALLIQATGEGKPFSIGLNIPLNKKVKSGDRLQVMFYAKLQQPAPDATASKISLRLQLAEKPYTSFADKSVQLTPEWKLYSMDAIADRDYAANALSCAFQLNYAKYAVALGVVAVFDQGK